MSETAQTSVADRWSQWLLRGREGGDQTLRERFLADVLLPVRDQVLDRGRVEKGEVVLDVGAGDGLIAFGALDRVGPTGHPLSPTFGEVIDKALSADEASRFVCAPPAPG